MLKFISRSFILLLVLLTPISAFSANNDRVQQFMEENAERVVSILSQNLNSTSKQERLVEIFEDIVDIDTMAKSAVGSYWQSFTEDERERYSSAYHEYLVNLYVPKFCRYNSGKFVITSVDSRGSNLYLVNTKIGEADSEKFYTVSYAIADQKGLRVRDIIAENVSLIATQRADFSAIINKGGVDGLIQTLNQKAQNK